MKRARKEIRLPRRICVVSTHPPNSRGWGGIVRSTRAYLRAWEQEQLEILFVSSDASSDGHVDRGAVASEYPGVHFQLYRSSWGSKWGVGLGAFRAILAPLDADCTIIHGGRTLPTVLAGLACRLFAKRYYVVLHGSMDRSRDERIAVKRRVLRALTQPLVLGSILGAKAIVLSGELERDTLLPELRQMPYRYIENFFDFPLDREFFIPKDRKNYLFVGRLSSDKGILAFTRIWISAAGHDSHFDIIGSGEGPYFEELRALATSDRRIKLHGELSASEVESAMRGAAVLVLPTGLDDQVTENFGNVIVEAFIAGRPVIVTSGLHWDAYSTRPCVIRMKPNAINVAEVIRRFDHLDSAEYEALARDAYELARSFHLSVGLEAVSEIFQPG